MPTSESPRFQALLASMPATRSDLTRMTGISKGNVYNLVEKLVGRGEAHVSGTAPGFQGAELLVFDVGPGKDWIRKAKPIPARPIAAIVLPQHVKVKQTWLSALGIQACQSAT